MKQEIAAMTTAHDEKIVAQFTRWARPFSELAVHAEAEGMRRTLAAANLTRDTRVLDVACGPGIVACATAAHAAHVTGIDLTPAMIEQAKARQARRGLSNCDWQGGGAPPAMIEQAKARQARRGLSNCDWQVGDATALPFADASFDIAITRYSFHH